MSYNLNLLSDELSIAIARLNGLKQELSVVESNLKLKEKYPNASHVIFYSTEDLNRLEKNCLKNIDNQKELIKAILKQIEKEL